MKKWFASSIFVGGLLCGSWVVLAQSPAAPVPAQYPSDFVAQDQIPPPGVKQPVGPMPPADKKVPGEIPDPTFPGPVWQQIFAQKNAKGAINAKIPNVSLRGRVLSRDKPAMAIIEIDGRAFMVGKDSLLTSAQTVLKVVELNAAEVRIEISPSNEIIILR